MTNLFAFTAVDANVLNGDLFVPYIYYVLTNAIPVAFGAMLVTFIEVCEYETVAQYFCWALRMKC